MSKIAKGESSLARIMIVEMPLDCELLCSAGFLRRPINPSLSFARNLFDIRSCMVISYLILWIVKNSTNSANELRNYAKKAG